MAGHRAWPRTSAAAAALVTLGLGLWALWIEPRRVVVKRRPLRLPRWPPGLNGLRVAVVADLHAGAPHIDQRKLERIVAIVNAQAPDLVALLGDYVDPEVPFGQRIEPEAVATRISALRAPLGVFAVLGNHDWAAGGERVTSALRAAGITVLDNDAVAVETAPQPLWIVGLDDVSGRGVDLVGALAQVPDDAPIIALTHTPDLFPRLPERIALTLAGHTHRGQIAVPLLRRKAIPSAFGERFAGGHVEEHGKHLFVSGGLGTSRFPVRLGTPPEVALLHLSAAE